MREIVLIEKESLKRQQQHFCCCHKLNLLPKASNSYELRCHAVLFGVKHVHVTRCCEQIIIRSLKLLLDKLAIKSQVLHLRHLDYIDTGTPPLTLFFGPGKNRVKGKPGYRRSILVLKLQNREYESSKSTFSSIYKLFPWFFHVFVCPLTLNDAGFLVS